MKFKYEKFSRETHGKAGQFVRISGKTTAKDVAGFFAVFYRKKKTGDVAMVDVFFDPADGTVCSPIRVEVPFSDLHVPIGDVKDLKNYYQQALQPAESSEEEEENSSDSEEFSEFEDSAEESSEFEDSSEEEFEYSSEESSEEYSSESRGVDHAILTAESNIRLCYDLTGAAMADLVNMGMADSRHGEKFQLEFLANLSRTTWEILEEALAPPPAPPAKSPGRPASKPAGRPKK